MRAGDLKFGAHIFLWVDHWDDSAAWLFDHAAALGLSCLEIAVGDDVVLKPSELRRRASAAGIELILSPGAEWPAECDISVDDSKHRQAGLAWHSHWIRIAGECGAEAYTGALYGHPGTALRRRPPPDELTRTAENLRRLADVAGEAGVTLALEPMSRFRTHIANTPEQVLRLIEAADHENLRVLFDTYHMVNEVRDYAAAIRTLAPRLWGVHACESDRGVPGGGLIPWKALFGALDKVGFAGYMLLESYNTSLGDFACRRGLFRDLCPDGDAFVRDGIRFLAGMCEERGAKSGARKSG
jgi:D-psicose/D-tagatose/L-ribulose 3-epimerase